MQTNENHLKRKSPKREKPTTFFCGKIEKRQKKNILAKRMKMNSEKLACLFNSNHVCNNHKNKGLKPLNDDLIWESNSQFLNEIIKIQIITSECIGPGQSGLLKCSGFIPHSFFILHK